MKIKKIIIILLLIILPIVIYITSIDRKIYYLSLGDSLALGITPYGKVGYSYGDYIKEYLENKKILEIYNNSYATNEARITDLIIDINNNKKKNIEGKDVTIKNALTRADLVTISIGLNDLLYKLGLNSIDFNLVDEEALKKYAHEVISDMEKLLALSRKYCKEDIVIIGYYNPLWQTHSTYSREVEPIFLYVNEETKKLTDKYDAYYVDLYSIFKENPEFLPNPIDIHPSSGGYNAIAREIIGIIEKNILN